MYSNIVVFYKQERLLQRYIHSKIRKMKLIYFNARGRAELARLILAQAGEAYDDERIEGADWPKLKPSKPILIPLISNSMSIQ